MTVMFTPLPREDAVSYLGPSWPAPPGTTVERVHFLSALGHGALAVQSGNQPGTTWWVVDGVIVPQDAGPLPELDGDQLETVQGTQPENPPIDTPPLDTP